MLYGLLGHCWIFQILAPNAIFRLPRGVLVMMMVWLLLCMSGVIALIGFGEIANGAHVSGLLVGCDRSCGVDCTTAVNRPSETVM